EAADMYDTLINEFGARMDADTRRSVDAEDAKLSARVVEVEVRGTAGAQLSVDGRPRGKLPLGHPLHLLPGARHVAASLAGFETFATDVTAKLGTTMVSIDANLRPGSTDAASDAA